MSFWLNTQTATKSRSLSFKAVSKRLEFWRWCQPKYCLFYAAEKFFIISSI